MTWLRITRSWRRIPSWQGAAIWISWLLVLACAPGPAPSPVPPRGIRVVTAPPPSASERYCAWFGARDGHVLYFGESPFWSAFRAGGDPRADLAHPGPQRVGRFDLRREEMLPPLDVGTPDARAGTWDVLAVEGRLYYTNFFEHSGFVELASDEVHRLPRLGTALNELAVGPGPAITVTRYGSGREEGGQGSALWIDRDGGLVAEHVLDAPEGFTAAPKTPAWDPTRAQLWLSMDLVPAEPGAPHRHDAYRLDLSGRLVDRIAAEHLHFAAMAPDGVIHMAWVRGRELSLRVGGVEAPGLVLDGDFPIDLDFVQDIQFADDGRVVLTRWSGVVHVVEPDGAVQSIALPHPDPQGLYYTGVLEGERLCVTYCADVSVVCVDAPRRPPRRAPP